MVTLASAPAGLDDGEQLPYDPRGLAERLGVGVRAVSRRDGVGAEVGADGGRSRHADELVRLPDDALVVVAEPVPVTGGRPGLG
jgi:hypothetical protein